MEVLRIAAISPPDSNRSQWARTLLASALEADLQPRAVPVQELVSFTATLSPALAARLRNLAAEKDMPLARLTAGLIEAQRNQDAPMPTCGNHAIHQDIPGAEHVRQELQGLLRTCVDGTRNGKIVFAEAATGTGKGRLIASTAACAAAKGDTVVIAAPLAVTWQLINDLNTIAEAKSAGITISLGRPNFVSPERTLEWAQEQDQEALAEWVRLGGQPITLKTKAASDVIEQDLCWMLEDALVLAENLPVDALMLRPEDSDECPAQRLYKSMRRNHTGAAIILCSHYMLASQVRLMQLRGKGEEEEGAAALLLPQSIDTLIVDEAHLLEQAFAAIYSHTLRLRPLIHEIDELPGKAARAAAAALRTLSEKITLEADSAQSRNRLARQLPDIPEIEQALRVALPALEKLKLSRAQASLAVTVHIAQLAMRDALSGHSRLRAELSPVRRYPSLVSGRANLRSALDCLWDATAGAALVSATLYAGDEKAMLIRWKLEVPPDRAVYAAPVHPAWTISPVTLHHERNTIEPNDSPEWVAETARLVLRAAMGARGGMLVLCTSHHNAEALHEQLSSQLGERLILQSRHVGAAMCAARFREMHQVAGRPVWIGLGAAWTGIDLSDKDAEPEQDTMLTDLVITRLPVGLNRSLTHERRMSIAGFKVVTMEAIWQLRQGLGRLVRRPGVKSRSLWVLDSRLSSSEAWVGPYRRLLSKYQAHQ